jgi:hypothetical protein
MEGHMRGLLVLGTLGLLLAGCAQPVPQDQGVGFGDYNTYQREAALTGAAPTGFAAPGTVATSPYGMATPTSAASLPPGGIPSTALAAAGIGVAPVASGPIGSPLPGVSSGAALPGISSSGAAMGAFTSSVPLPGASAPGGFVSVASSGVAGDVNTMRATGLEASPSNAAPTLVGTVPGNTGGISDEQDFEAVSSRESIESDAARRAQQAAQYQVLQPQALPAPPPTTGPNIVEYALNAPNSLGQPWYSRFILFAREGRADRNCAKYRTADEAQRDFLARGGPDKDSLGLDPDGDGFACAWDPAPFRAAVGRG